MTADLNRLHSNHDRTSHSTLCISVLHKIPVLLLIVMVIVITDYYNDYDKDSYTDNY